MRSGFTRARSHLPTAICLAAASWCSSTLSRAEDRAPPVAKDQTARTVERKAASDASRSDPSKAATPAPKAAAAAAPTQTAPVQTMAGPAPRPALAPPALDKGRPASQSRLDQ